MRLDQSTEIAPSVSRGGIATISAIGKALAWDFSAGLQELRQPDWNWLFKMTVIEHIVAAENE